jgi:sorting nexin-1/2
VVKYTVTGTDSQGPIEIQRRYNEFLALQNSLNTQWPGCYVPAIPEKQLIGDKDDNFVEERRQLLERFIQECSKYNYIIESEEFQIFARAAGEIVDRLDKLPKQGPGKILDKYRAAFPNIQEEAATEMAGYREKINVFSNFLSKCQASNQTNRDSMMNSVKHHKANAEDYKALYTLMMQYEQQALEYFSENEMNSRVLTHPKAGEFGETLQPVVQNFKNPFLEAAIWIKGEMLDIAGMLNAMKGRDLVMKRQLATEGKKRDDQEELEKLSLGKTTLKSFFKSKAGKEQDQIRL